MNIIINGLTLGEGTDYIIQAPVEGLSKPPIRTAEGEFGGSDGGYVSSQLYSKRRISITGTTNTVDCASNESLRHDLIEAMPIRTLLPVFIRTFTGKWYLLEAYVVDLKMDVESRHFSNFKIDMVCPNPYIFDGGDGTDPEDAWIEQSLHVYSGGGYTTPYSLPVQWSPGTPNDIISNSGLINVYPQVILTGEWQNVSITNVTTNQTFILNVTTSNPSDEIVIDMDNKTVTLNGGSIASLVDDLSEWLYLAPGDNVIRTNSAGSATEGIIRYRVMYPGI